MSKKKDAEIKRIFLADYRSNTASEVMAERDAVEIEIERLLKLMKDVVDGSYWDDDYTLVPHCLFEKLEREVSDE